MNIRFWEFNLKFKEELVDSTADAIDMETVGKSSSRFWSRVDYYIEETSAVREVVRHVLLLPSAVDGVRHVLLLPSAVELEDEVAPHEKSPPRPPFSRSDASTKSGPRRST